MKIHRASKEAKEGATSSSNNQRGGRIGGRENLEQVISKRKR